MGVGTLPSAYCYCAWRRSIPPWSRRGGRWVPSHGARPNVSVLGVCTLKFVPPVPYNVDIPKMRPTNRPRLAFLPAEHRVNSLAVVAAVQALQQLRGPEIARLGPASLGPCQTWCNSWLVGSPPPSCCSCSS